MAAPLNGVRILDFTHTLAGFFCTVQLADFGADVTKVEPPMGNVLRQDEPRVRGESAYFMAINRNKRSIVLNLKHHSGREVAQTLAEHSDVVVNNFRSGVMDALGLGYEQLSARNPRLIYATLSGYGVEGPYRDRAAYDPTIQAFCGLMSVTGEADRPPAICGVPVSDLASGTFMAQGILAALYERAQSGQGQRLDVAMLDVLLFFSGYHAPAFLADGREYGRLGSRHPFVAPYGVFEAADGYLVLIGRTDEQFRQLCRALEVEDWPQDERFATAKARLAHREELERLLAERVGTRTRDQWMERLDECGVPAAPVNTFGEVLSDPAVRRRTIVQQGHPRGGTMEGVANPLHFERTPVDHYGPSPLFGQHTRAVLRELGYADGDIARLAGEGVVVIGEKE